QPYAPLMRPSRVGRTSSQPVAIQGKPSRHDEWLQHSATSLAWCMAWKYRRWLCGALGLVAAVTRGRAPLGSDPLGRWSPVITPHRATFAVEGQHGHNAHRYGTGLCLLRLGRWHVDAQAH